MVVPNMVIVVGGSFLRLGKAAPLQVGKWATKKNATVAGGAEGSADKRRFY
jgi:hypothetical protein